MNQKTNSKAILLDADVLIHFSTSSNLKDIQKYCETHQIVYLTTMDLLCEALRSGEMTEEDCDKFIEKVLAQDSRLPCQFISQYSERRFL